MRRRLWAVGAVVALVAAGMVTWLVVRDSVVVPFGTRERCEATVQGRTVAVDPEQAGNAALMAAISMRRGLPARAATIAIATSYQESKLYNLEYGDRDSLGLFQQRPSQGWGTRAEVMDPEHAINAFYDALVQVDGFETMEVTVAAQQVQRSGYPSAYADHEQDARVLASALTGQSWRAFDCTVTDEPDATSSRLDGEGLTRRAAAVRDDLQAAFGTQSLGGFAPGGVRSGHMPGSAHYEGRAVDVFFRPATEDNRERGWAMAQYLVAQAARLDIHTVIYDGRIWTAGLRSVDGWRRYAPDTTGRSAESAAILEHRDHVHVDVYE